MDNVGFIKDSYENPHRPMHFSRSLELGAVTVYAAHYGVTITEHEFDCAIADLFGAGVDYEWPRD